MAVSRAEAVGTAPAFENAETSEPRDPITETIAGVERLYKVVTGSAPPPTGEQPYAPIPVEKDPGDVVAERVDRLLEVLTTALPTASGRWSPPMTVWQDERGLLLCFEVAGVSRRDLEVSLDGDVLTVTGKRATTRDGMRLRGSERPLGAFVRQVILPRTPRGGDLTAQLREGVLEIVVPQKSDALGAGPRTIAVV